MSECENRPAEQFSKQKFPGDEVLAEVAPLCVRLNFTAVQMNEQIVKTFLTRRPLITKNVESFSAASSVECSEFIWRDSNPQQNFACRCSFDIPVLAPKANNITLSRACFAMETGHKSN